MFSELVFVLWDMCISRLLSDVTLFEALRAMNEVRPFKLVFLLQGKARQKLAETLDSVAAKGFLNFLDSPPTIRLA